MMDTPGSATFWSLPKRLALMLGFCLALVGAAGNVGAVAMQSVGMALETHAKTGVVPVNATQQLERLRGYWEKTRAVLDNWL